MIRKTVWIAGLGTTTIIAMLLMSPRSPNVAAKTQQAATAEVKIDNFTYGPATLTVAVGTTVT